MWAQVEPRRYARQVDPWSLVQSFMMAFVCYAPGLRAVASAACVGTRWASTLSYAVRSAAALRLVRAMIAQVCAPADARRDDLIALDSMALTLRKTLRHGCRRFNDTVVGGGVLWGWNVSRHARRAPLSVMGTMAGAWHDSRTVRTAQLVAHGPVYLMDRGFWSLENVETWLQRGVGFVLRVTASTLRYETLRRCGAARAVGRVRIEHDVIARLGRPKARRHPRVRLVVARLENGDDLILVSDREAWSAEQILEGYRQRWQIERFHTLLKQNIGLAHLYSYQQRGIEWLLHVAVLLGLLLWGLVLQRVGDGAPLDDAIKALAQQLAQLRAQRGLFGRWRPNTPQNLRQVRRAKRVRRVKPQLTNP